MSQQDRGAYTPQTDAPLAFDARAPRGARKPLPLALIGSGIVLLALVAAVVLYYTGGARAPGGAPPVVGEPVGAVKTAPPAEAANDDPFSNLDVYASQNVPETPAAAQPNFAPAPEQPQPRPAPQLQVQTVEPSGVHAVPGAGVRPAAPAPQPAQPAPQTAAAQPAPAAPARPAPAQPAATPAPAPRTAAAPAPAGGGAMVQIGAFSSQALADKGYSDIAAAFPSQMSGKSKRVEPLQRDGKTLYRGMIGGFADRGAAQAFCDALKASGRTCLVRG